MRRLAAAAADAATSLAKCLAILVMLVAMVWAAVHTYMEFVFPDHAHRFRLTVEVDALDGIRSGSSVVEVERVPNFPTRHTFRVRGEAVFVDLGGGRNLVAVLAHGENAEDVDRITSFWIEAYGHERSEEDDVWSGRKALRGVVELKPPLIPTLVTFSYPLDPSTVRVVRPGEFERVFGPGFRFRRATLEVVPASVPVTSSVIEQRLPWLIGMTTNLAGTQFRSTNDIRERLIPRRFKRQDP